jgi:hypothetical protein
LLSTAAFAAEPAAASNGQGPYCLKYFEGGKDCGFTSLAECEATASGIDAECYAADPQAFAAQARGADAPYRPDTALTPKRSSRPDER